MQYLSRVRCLRFPLFSLLSLPAALINMSTPSGLSFSMALKRFSISSFIRKSQDKYVIFSPDLLKNINKKHKFQLFNKY